MDTEFRECEFSTQIGFNVSAYSVYRLETFRPLSEAGVTSLARSEARPFGFLGY
jgi:hypothetical protein